MISLAPIDFALISIYILVVLYLGYRASIKETTEGFLLADRKLGPLKNAATIVASKTGAGLVLTFVALVYMFGISAMWFFVGASIGYLVFMLFAIRLRQESSKANYYTLSDYFFHKYGNPVGLVSAIVILVVMLLNFVIQLVGGSKVLGSLTGLPFLVSLSILSLIMVTYLIMGGFRAVVLTDVAQFVAIIVLALIIGILLLGGISPSPVAATAGSVPLKSIIGFFIFGIILPFASAELWQRVYAAKDVSTVRKSLLFSALFYILIGSLFLLIGLAIRSQLAGIDPDIALIEGFASLLPHGFVGIGVITILAAVMSSADTYLFTNTSILLQDFYDRYKRLSKESLVTNFRYSLAILMVLGVILAVILQSVVTTAFLFTGFAAVIAVAGISSWLFKGVQGTTLILAMVFGFVGTFIYVVTTTVTETLALNSIIFTLAGLSIGGLLQILRKKSSPSMSSL